MEKILKHGLSSKASVLLRTCFMTEVGMFLRSITQHKDEVTLSVNTTVPVSCSLMSPVRLCCSGNSRKLPTDSFCRGLVGHTTRIHPKTVTHNMRLRAHSENAACVSVFFHTTPFTSLALCR